MGMIQTKPLEEIIKKLPPEALQEVEDFASFLLEKKRPKKKQKPTLFQEKRVDFSRLLGIALKGPTNPNPRFKSEDDLWKDEPW